MCEDDERTHQKPATDGGTVFCGSLLLVWSSQTETCLSLACAPFWIVELPGLTCACIPFRICHYHHHNLRSPKEKGRLDSH